MSATQLQLSLASTTESISLEICVLGSGSGGNSTLIRTGQGVTLLDVGFGPRVTAGRLVSLGVSLDHIRAICLTHLDHDHFNPNWLATIVRRKIRVHCHKSRVHELLSIARDRGHEMGDRITAFDGRAFEPMAGVWFEPIHLAHDEAGSHGFLICAGERRIGYATDLGRVPDKLLELFCGVDLLALEANYDPEMQKNSARPWFLKKRIMGGKGHLSNEQALAAVKEILDAGETRDGRLPTRIVLLHRSRECNCPQLMRRLFERDERIRERLVLAEQFEGTGWIAV